ncbi:MAG: type-F conjugative transfer system protein TraW [Gammaproteobacteria bacterium]|nr:type-F conjugative transfer system protein TraW [Gammaproteobacteria bacterium]MDH5651258.1 type-F conjugative transfer system protein TraW [Gammaproteobacteria bacterium]
MRGLWILIAFSLSSVAVAGTGIDLGRIGQTYAIAEPSLLEHLYTKLKTAKENGDLSKLETVMKNRVAEYVHRPDGIDLPRSQQSRVHYYNPAVRFSQDIKDQDGNVLWPAGTMVNPLDYITLSQQWIFFNGDDPDQTTWVKQYANRQSKQIRLILTQGAVLELMKSWDKRIYFDQHGSLVKRFGITSLPTVVRQEGKQLRVESFVPEVNAHG